MNLLTETEQFKNTFESMQRDYDRGLCQKKYKLLLCCYSCLSTH